MNAIESKKRDRSALVAELEKAGAEFKGNICKCPFHDDKRPSAGIYQKNGHWQFKCQSCGVFGDVWDMKARNENCDVSEVLSRVRRESGASDEKSQPVVRSRKKEKPVNAFQSAIMTSLKDAVNDLKPRKSRGASKSSKEPKVYKTVEAAAREHAQWAGGEVENIFEYTDPQTQKLDMFVVRIVLPEGKTFRQGHSVDGGFVMEAPPKPWPLYDRLGIQSADTVVVVEGEKCVHALKDYNIIATTSPGGACKADHVDWSPLAGKNVILWPDNDDPGRKHVRQVEEILQRLEPPPRVSLIEPTDLDLSEKEDAADLVEQLQTAELDVRYGLQEALQRAKPRGITSGLTQRIEDTINGKLQAIGWPQSDLSTLSKALIPGTVTLICGSPGASKSFWLLECIAYWLDNGIRACVYELEEDLEFHLMRSLSQRSKQSNLTDPEWVAANPDQARQTLVDHAEFLERMGRSIYAAPEIQVTLEQLAEWAESRAKAGYRVICIDPVTAAVQTEKPWIADSTFLQKIKRAATDHGCSFVLVTHPTKTVSFADMNQLAGSAAYSRFAQCIFWLEAHDVKQGKVWTCCGSSEVTHNRTLHILKARNGKGHGKSLACEFENETLKLIEYGLIVKSKKQNN